MSTFNYAARDYDTIKSELLARAERVFPDWTDRDPSDFGMMLVDLWAVMGDVMHYYADRAAAEAFLSTASQRESVLAIANLLDYRPVGRTSATGTVEVANATGSDYLVAKDTEFVARHNNKTYTLHALEDATVPAGGSNIVQVAEGEIVEDEVLVSQNASGLPGQRYTLADPTAYAGSIRIDVYEDGVTPVPYSYVNRLGLAAAGARVYTTLTGPEGGVQVQFGTITTGFVPPKGSTITATYSTSSGAAGNLPAGVVTGFSVSAPPGISVSTSSALSGGSDEESIASIKQSVPSVVSAQDRAVTRNDFAALALSVPGVDKVAVHYQPPVAAGTLGSIDTYSISSEVADVVFAAPVSVVTGDIVSFSGSPSGHFDGAYVVTEVLTGDTVRINVPDASDVSSTSAGSATAVQIVDSVITLYCQPTRSDYLTTADTTQAVSSTVRSDVVAAVQPKALHGVTVEAAETVYWQEIDITATVTVNSRAITNSVQNAVEEALDNLFSFNNVRFGQLLHLGQVHRIVLNVPGVDYVVVEKFAPSTSGPTQVDQTIRVSDLQLPKKGTVSLTFTGGISVS